MADQRTQINAVGLNYVGDEIDDQSFRVVTARMAHLSSGGPMKTSEFERRMKRYREIATDDTEPNRAMRAAGLQYSQVQSSPSLSNFTGEATASLWALLKPDWNAETGSAAVKQLRAKVATQTANLAREAAARSAPEDWDAILPIT
jgi:hypothetical protein